MPKVCTICRSSADDREISCPACGGALRAATARPGAFGELARGLGLGWEHLLGSGVALVVGFVLLAGVSGALSERMLWGSSDPAAGQAQDSSGRIRVGMHLCEVGRVLDKGPPRTPSYPRMRDYFPADEFGDGTVDYEGDGVVLKIHFVYGRVTAVEESKSSAGPGFHSCRTSFITRR